MRFVIDKIEQKKCMTLVTGQTSVGTIEGVWKGAEPPVINSNYHIELGIDYPCELNISLETQTSPYVCLDKDMVVFQGVCEAIDEDVYYIRFDIDWLEMLEINTITAKKEIGDYISFSANIYDIRIYPYML